MAVGAGMKDIADVRRVTELIDQREQLIDQHHELRHNTPRTEARVVLNVERLAGPRSFRLPSFVLDGICQQLAIRIRVLDQLLLNTYQLTEIVAYDSGEDI